MMSRDPVEELNSIFDQVVQEIEERQQFLESVDHLDEPKLKDKIKREIIERIAELQKITEMRQRFTNE